MAERIFDGELRRMTRPIRRDDHGPGAVGPLAQKVLSLQATAGNAAVARVVQVVQRAPKQPAWATSAESTLKAMFPKEKLLQGVVIKDYAGLNKTLQGAPFGAWTNSKTEIYIKDPALFANTPPTQAMALQYILQHEANHVRQFAKSKGPPKLWETMAKFEIEAYKNDIAWLNGAGKSVVTDATLHKELLDGARKNLKDLQDLVKTAAKLKGTARETAFLDGMLDKSLVPPDSSADPQDLYKQSP